MKVKIFKLFDTSPRGPSLWLERVEDLPFVPFPGLFISVGEYEEKIEQVTWDLDHQELKAYCEADVSLRFMVVDPSEYQERLQEYLDAGWRIRGKNPFEKEEG